MYPAGTGLCRQLSVNITENFIRIGWVENVYISSKTKRHHLLAHGLSIDTCTYVDYRKNAVLDGAKMEISGPAYAKSTVGANHYIHLCCNE